MAQPPGDARYDRWRDGMRRALAALDAAAGDAVLPGAPPRAGDLQECVTRLSDPADWHRAGLRAVARGQRRLRSPAGSAPRPLPAGEHPVVTGQGVGMPIAARPLEPAPGTPSPDAVPLAPDMPDPDLPVPDDPGPLQEPDALPPPPLEPSPDVVPAGEPV